MESHLGSATPVRVSWSSLKRWENCPHHQYQVIAGKTKAPDFMGRVFLPGTVCDLAQRRWLMESDYSPGGMAQLVPVIMDEVVEKREYTIKWKHSKDKDDLVRQCQALVTRVEPWLRENVLPFRFQAEVRFNAAMEIPYICEDRTGLVKMQGGIDLLVQDDSGKFKIFDLKITESLSYVKASVGQLTFYDLAWGLIQENFNHATEWGFITPGLEEGLVPVQVTSEDRHAMLSRIVAYAQSYWRDSWAPKEDDAGCQYCPAHSVCAKFQKIPVTDVNGKQRFSFEAAASQRKEARK